MYFSYVDPYSEFFICGSIKHWTPDQFTLPCCSSFSSTNDYFGLKRGLHGNSCFLCSCKGSTTWQLNCTVWYLCGAIKRLGQRQLNCWLLWQCLLKCSLLLLVVWFKRHAQGFFSPHWCFEVPALFHSIKCGTFYFVEQMLKEVKSDICKCKVAPFRCITKIKC